MTPVELLQEKFNATGCASVTDWMNKTKADLSLQAATIVLLRGKSKGLLSMLKLASALECTPHEMQWIAKELGDDTFWRLITPSTIISKEQNMLITDYEALTPNQRQLVNTMIQQMLPVPKGGAK